VDATIRLTFSFRKDKSGPSCCRHVKPGSGLGLKFTALTEEDGPRLTALMTRFAVSSQPQPTRMKGPAISLVTVR